MSLSDQNRSMGSVLFQIVLWLSIPYWGLGMVKGVVFDGAIEILILDSISFLLSVLVFVLWRWKWVRQDLLVNVYAGIWIVMFAFYWKYMDGLDGPFSYAFFTLMIFFVGVLENKFRMVFVSLLVFVNIFLTLYGEFFPFTVLAERNEALINPMAVNYIFNAIVIGMLVGYLKYNFDNGREGIRLKNIKLDQLNLELEEKRQALISQKEIIVKIQNNLETLIKDRIQEHELRNVQLQDYAYHNTHIVRGPLTNVMAVVDLMKQNHQSGKITIKHLNEIEKYSNDLDKVINKINLVLK